MSQMSQRSLKRCFGVVVFLFGIVSLALADGPAKHVITISVDGMGSSYMLALADAGKLPNMQRLREQGAVTLNARTDYDFTITLPNHTCMVTSRGVKGEQGHNWSDNTDPKPGQTLHSSKGSHISTVFEVAHDAALRTGMWSTKSKFSLFHDSCAVEVDAATQANKMDVFCRLDKAELITANFLQEMQARPLDYAFIHFGDTDAAGHSQGWGSDAYNAAMIRVDGCIGQILQMVAASDALRGTTAVVLTADHGGFEKNHGDAKLPIDYTVPFVTWGAGVEQGDLYQMNPTRQDPGTGRPTYDEPRQPVRNGDAGNLGMRLLGLKAIPGSTIGNQFDLRTTKPAPAAAPAIPLQPATQPSKQAA